MVHAQVGGRLCNAVHAEEVAAAAGGATSRLMRSGSLVPASGCGVTAGGADTGAAAGAGEILIFDCFLMFVVSCFNTPVLASGCWSHCRRRRTQELLLV